MDESPADEKKPRASVRRRGREPGGPRSHRFKVSFNDAELAIVQEAADRENQALASWVGQASLAVATEQVVPVSADAKVVLQELIRSRGQLRRVGNNLNQMAYALNAEGEVTNAQIRAVLALVNETVRHVDEATLQVMRERRPRA
ncbi:MobC family plasmid mobilization relaxosome protein [Streptomyces violarus]|uniref:MobC family plasmid mobilization relaxosome protein n=1 Tax=Streptomyces violarus TaxID=67380 RepID=UPI0021C23ED2|nr:MobC family plasmid mobilization relaxosome protein [Streptomyces violarus]MCT9144056.1 MobC family plasmid mobilization relaxosome protein [Streptomyces violarus]